MTERLTYPEAIEVVGKLVSRFPNGTPANAQGYIGGLAEILLAYPRSIGLRCHDPLKGVARDTKFLPSPADLIGWLERETEMLRRPVEISDRFENLAQAQRERAAKEPVRERRPSLEELRAKHGPNWGIVDREGKPPPLTKEEARLELISQIGQAAFDALPDTGWRTDDWAKRPKEPDEDWVKAEFPAHKFAPGEPSP